MANDDNSNPPEVLSALQKTAAIANFKDWTNYLLVTTVAALGWVSAQPPDMLARICAVCLALSIVAGIFTLAMVPLITERIGDGPESIYDMTGNFTLWWMAGPTIEKRLKHFCWPQHVLFLLGIVLFAARYILKTESGAV